MKKIIAIQTARAGSKSVKKKNLIRINGTPIFLHSLKSAIDCKMINRVVCSTNDKEIIRLSRKYKYNIIERPKFLSGDRASHFDTILANKKINNGPKRCLSTCPKDAPKHHLMMNPVWPWHQNYFKHRTHTHLTGGKLF